jgi:hypothetical protein
MVLTVATVFNQLDDSKTRHASKSWSGARLAGSLVYFRTCANRGKFF